MTSRNIVWSGRLAAALALALAPAALDAQSLGTFEWQLQPYCNVLHVRVDAGPDGVFRVEGYDDQCGAPSRAPAVGVATLNPDGSVGLGLHLVTGPQGRPLTLDARVDPGSGHGSWRDSAGQAGRFALGARTGGTPRPEPTIPAAAIATGAITAAHLAPGLIGTVAQSRVGGLCTNGQAMRGINPDGTVACTNAATTVDDRTDVVGVHPAIAIGADGRPIVAHYNTTNLSLQVTHCGDSACVAGNRTRQITATQSAWGAYASIAIGTDGLPILAYADHDADRLQITHCGAVDCSAGNVTTAVSGPGGNAGEYTAIAIGADGLPIVSHYGNGTGLLVTHCTTITCSVHETTKVDPVSAVTGIGTAIAIGRDGLPIVSHLDTGVGALRVTRCGNVACTAGNVSRQVDGPGNVGETALVIDAAGRPIIASTTKGGLRLTRCADPVCAQPAESRTIEVPPGLVGFEPSIALGADGVAVISHGDRDADALVVTHCGDASCSAPRTTRVDPLPLANGYLSSLAIGRDGLPIVAHWVKGAGALRVTKCGTATCQ